MRSEMPVTLPRSGARVGFMISYITCKFKWTECVDCQAGVNPKWMGQGTERLAEEILKV
jgi:hypothetical protein